MNKVEELTKLIEEDVLPEIEDFIDDLFEQIADNKEATVEDKEELKEIQTLRSDFKEMLEDIQSGDVDEEEAIEIIEEINEMRSEK